ncbi:ABC transporter ATP-binding protein [Schaedlerella arabinosiphila]|uniref:ABC transporter ATP-binding protein n=1 Tax=Schaedlerella arabinosiphila TaxID=2044587 RepID=A0A9X5C7W6_9FIRM|nr:ABC transporter ATP-binding protein [Schaedlerella arabinosiphila]NDO69754.1 ABC transporter ATP-binding protein [Schaedlerella arabinosiphila]
MGDLMRLCGLGKAFPQRQRNEITILRNITITMGEGETVCVLGESGCGKTTLGRIVAGVSDYTAGSYRFQGKEVSEMSKEERNQFRNSVQMIHQNPYESLNPTMMVFDIIANPIRRHHKIVKIEELYEKVTELLETVGLTPVEDFVDKYPAFLSGGQRQRVSIARTLAMNPKLIVVDEATSMVDTSLRISLLGTLKKIQEETGVSYFFITHDLALGKYFAQGQKAVIMYLGQIVEECSMERLVEYPCHPYTKEILSAAVGSSDILEKDQGKKYRLTGTDNPSFKNLPSGCPLHPRCPQKMAGTCDVKIPESAKAEQGHYVRCHLYEEERQR